MEIQGPLTVEDLQEAGVLVVPKLLRGSVRRSSRQLLNPPKWKAPWLGAVALLFLIDVLRAPGVDTSKRVILALLVILVVYQISFGSMVTRKWHQKRIARIPRVLSVDPDGVRFEDRTKICQFRPWSAYKIWREGALIFYLRGPQQLSHIVPKRGLAPEQMDALRTMLATHIPGSE